MSSLIEADPKEVVPVVGMLRPFILGNVLLGAETGLPANPNDRVHPISNFLGGLKRQLEPMAC